MKYLTENIKPILALLVMVSGISYIFAISFIPTNNDVDQGIIAITALMAGVSGYYFGSSQGAAKKDETINEMSKK